MIRNRFIYLYRGVVYAKMVKKYELLRRMEFTLYALFGVENILFFFFLLDLIIIKLIIVYFIFMVIGIQNSLHFRPQNNPFEQGHCSTEIGQVYRTEQQDRDQTIEQHQPFLQNCFPEKELCPHNQQGRKNDGEK